jgi:hypothetical protein
VERTDRAIACAAATFLAVLGSLPLVNWLPGGHSATWYPIVLSGWLSGTAIVAGLAVVLTILSRRVPVLWRPGLLAPLEPLAARRSTLVIVAILAGLVYAAVGRIVFDAKPLLIDEIIQVFQGRIFASGRLWLPASPHPEFTSSFHLLDFGGRIYGHFPPGGPAMLALGSLLHAEWLTGPVFGAISVALFGGLVRRSEPLPVVRLAATLLFALAPFVVFMSGSYMNHVTGLTWLLVGMVGLARATSEREGRFVDGLIAGLGFGIAATIRPVDAIAFALPAGLWLLWRARRRHGLAPLLGAGVGIAIPVAVLLWVNLETTGSPLLFAYTLLWGSTQGLGFHATPWGEAHTPLRGLELLNLYFLRLQTYLFELPVPSLLPAVVALALTRRLSSLDRYLLASGALLCGIYFAYWFDGFYLGPRFMYPLAPVLVLWSARVLPAIRHRFGTGSLLRASAYGVFFALGIGVTASLPGRARQYRAGMLTPRWDADRAAERAGVRNAIVFVRESWGSELVARMWALGISRPDAEAVYRSTDACRLELVLGSLETGGVRGQPALSALRAAAGDATSLLHSEALTGDPSILLTRGAAYPPRCIEKIRANQSGFTLLAPLLLSRGSGNLYFRDLGRRDTLVLREYPGRPVYLLKPLSGAVGAAPAFLRVRADSTG